MRTFWIYFDRLRLPLLLVALLAPFVLTALAIRFEERNTKEGYVRHFRPLSCSGCLIGTIISVVLLFMTTCGTPVGKGDAAEKGYKRAAPVIAGLERFHADSGSYPVSLHLLVPKYLSEEQFSWTMVGSTVGLEYGHHADEFHLMFRYSGPGSNTCTYESRVSRWSCQGLF